MRDIRDSFDVGMFSSFSPESFLTRDDGATVMTADEISYWIVGQRIVALSCQETFETLQNALGTLHIYDRTRIMQIIVDAPEDYRNLFFEFADRINVRNMSASGVFRTPRGTIDFNVSEDRNGPKGSYFVFFHEIGHMIDWALVNDRSHLFSNSFFTRQGSFSDTLFNALEKDVESKLRSLANELFGISNHPPEGVFSPQVAEEQNTIKNKAISNIMAGNIVVAGPGLSSVEQFQLLLQNETNSALRGNSNSDRDEHNMVNPSNVFGGITNNAVRGNWSHTRDNYWFDNSGNPTYRQNSEFFANHFAAAMLNDEQMLQNERDFFPEAMGVMDDIIIHMTSQIGG